MSESVEKSVVAVTDSTVAVGNQCTAMAVFAEPEKAAPKLKRKVLEEDEYLEKIEHIIERDFFPDVAKLKAQFAYQDAVERKDHVEIARLKEKFSVRNSGRPDTGLSAAGTFETPIRPGTSATSVVASEDKLEEKKEEVAPNTTLDKFLAKNTSEDNASFEEIMHETKKREVVKYPWLFADESEANSMIEKALELPSIEMQAIEDKRPAGLLTWHFKNKNTVMYYPEGVELTADEKEKLAKNVKSVVHENTRLARNPFNDAAKSAAAAAQGTASAGKFSEGRIGVDGKLVPTEGPIINGYSMVTMTPTPNPENIDSTPLMTWGEIEGTPFRLDVPDTLDVLQPGTPQFRIPELSARDSLAYSLADRLSSQHRGRKKKAIEHVVSSLKSPHGSNSHKTSGDRLSTMSPAAQRLARMKMGLGTFSDPALQASYSPAHVIEPSPSRPSSSRGLRATPSPAPSSSSGQTPKSSSADSSSITDNLLNLPKRPKATDFF